MTEQLFVQQLESPSGPGRDEPRSKRQPDSPALNERDTTSRHPFSLAVMHDQCHTTRDTEVVREPIARGQRPIGMVSAYRGARPALAGLIIACGIGLAACGSSNDSPAARAPDPDSRPTITPPPW